MAKDTRDIPSGGAAKEGLKKIAQRADETIVAQSKDASNESIQAGNAARMEGLPSSSSAGKDAPAIADPLRKPNIEPLDPTPGQEARSAARNVGTGRVNRTTVLDFGKLPSRPEGGAKPASVNVTDKPDVAVNLIDRMKSGMGLPGEEQGHLDRAVALHSRDREIAARTGKTVNGVQPNDPQATAVSVFGGHHHRLAKVMHTFGIADEEVYKNAASQSGQRLETYVHGLHKIAQEHEDSKRQITHTPKEGALWEHPTTKEVIPVAANHPDMPSAFTRTKGKVARVTRNASGAEVVERSHEGWDPIKVAGGKTIYRQNAAPKGIDLVDHMRVQMLGEHGPSSSSRKRGGDIATEIANTVSGAVPRGKKQIGMQKVAKSTTPSISSRPKAATRPHGSSTQPADKTYRYSPANTEEMKPIFVDKAPQGTRADAAPRPPKAKKGMVLVGSKEPADLPTFTGKGRPAVQPALPGTGVPKTVAEIVTPAQYQRTEGPLEKWAAESVGTKVGKSTITEEDRAPRIKVANEVVKTSLVPTDRDWKPQVDNNNPNRGQQFKVTATSNMAGPGQTPKVSTSFEPETTSTGLDDLRTIKNAGALTSQKKSSSTELEVRPGGKRKAARDRKAMAKAAPNPMEQPSLFPDFGVKEGRSNAFYMAGSLQPISEASKTLQGSAKQDFGRQPNNKDFATENEGSIVDRLQKGKKAE